MALEKAVKYNNLFKIYSKTSIDKIAKNFSKNQVGKVKTIVFFLFSDIMFHFILLSMAFHGINRHFNS
jgi:hypothetical protein